MKRHEIRQAAAHEDWLNKRYYITNREIIDLASTEAERLMTPTILEGTQCLIDIYGAGVTSALRGEGLTDEQIIRIQGRIQDFREYANKLLYEHNEKRIAAFCAAYELDSQRIFRIAPYIFDDSKVEKDEEGNVIIDLDMDAE